MECTTNCSDACLPELAFFLIRHIIQGDMDFKSFLEGKSLWPAFYFP